MLFSVIVSVDAPPPMRRYLPRRSLRKRLRGDYGPSEYRYLADEGCEYWKNAQEWKGAGILTRPEFEALVEDLDAYSSRCHTGGSLGGPLGPWVVPDVDFSSDSRSSIICLRATPILEHASNEASNEDKAQRKWDRLEQAMWRQYERGTCSHFIRVPMKARERWQERFPLGGPKYSKAVQRARKAAKSNPEVARFM